jgi:hypothetical protein
MLRFHLQNFAKIGVQEPVGGEVAQPRFAASHSEGTSPAALRDLGSVLCPIDCPVPARPMREGEYETSDVHREKRRRMARRRIRVYGFETRGEMIVAFGSL